MIETETTCTITCDKCGKAIAEGEPWYFVRHTVTTSIFAGNVSDLHPVLEDSMQLCQLDYDAAAKQLGTFAETAQRIAPPPAPVVAEG